MMILNFKSSNTRNRKHSGKRSRKLDWQEIDLDLIHYKTTSVK